MFTTQSRFLIGAVLLGGVLAACTPPPPQTSALTPAPTVPGSTVSLGDLVDPTAEVTKVTGDLQFTEGPVWSPDNRLLFSDIPANRIYAVDPQDGRRVVFLEPSHSSNGLTYDDQDRLLLCEHKTRLVSRLHADGHREVLADRWQGKRFSSPNDLVYHPATGTIFFTDPPWGLKGQDNDPTKEIAFNGVFRRDADGEVTVVDSTLHRPNGIAVSPDGRWLYVGESSRDQRAYWVRYALDDRARPGAGQRWAEADQPAHKGNADGLKVDERGNLYGTGPGGIWVFSPEGSHLGTLTFPEQPTNCAWGGADGRTLYVTAQTSVYALPCKVAGVRP